MIAAEVNASTECVVMPPGSSWSDTRGFDIVGFDFAKRESYVQMMLERNAQHPDRCTA